MCAHMCTQCAHKRVHTHTRSPVASPMGPYTGRSETTKASPCGMLSFSTWHIVFHDWACAVPEAVLSFEHSWQLNWNRNHIASLVTMVIRNYHKYLLMTSLEKQATKNRRMNICRSTWENPITTDLPPQGQCFVPSGLRAPHFTWFLGTYFHNT